MTTTFGPTRTAGDAELLDRKVTGDFVVRADADPEKVATALEKILRKECDLPVTLKVHDVGQNVYVLSGKYVAKPLADRKKNQIEVYSFQLTDRTKGGGGSGTLQEMLAPVEGFYRGPDRPRQGGGCADGSGMALQLPFESHRRRTRAGPGRRGRDEEHHRPDRADSETRAAEGQGARGHTSRVSLVMGNTGSRHTRSQSL